MDAQVIVDTRELDAIVRRFQGAEALLDREVQVALDRSTILVQNDARVRLTNQGAIDTGALRASLTRQVSADEGVVGTNKSYAPVVEYGRRAGAPMPPEGALLGWMSRHGIAAEKEYAVRRNIRRRGIRARPYLIPALLENVDAIRREFDAAAQRVLQKLGFR